MHHPILKKLPYFKKLILQLETLETDKQQLQAQCDSLKQQFQHCDCLPIPPPELMTRVNGEGDPDQFLGGGRKIYWDLKKILRGVNKSWESFHTILDFGCGCGRILRFLKPSPNQTLAGTDIDTAAIAWCSQHLSHLAQFQVNHHLPPLSYPDEHFDFIYAVSVFTHLPEPLQFLWLAELKRVLKPGGILIASIHDEQNFPLRDQPEAWTPFQQQGFYYLKNRSTPGLPDYYQNTYHTHAYVQTQWSRYFKILSIPKRAINNRQDAVVALRTFPEPNMITPWPPELKVFGIGLNKTGTKTLGECLRQLGSRRHLTFDLQDLRHLKRGNLQLLLDKISQFDSGEDWPWPLMFDILDQYFPQAKFILTTRQTPEIWFNSLCRLAERTGPTEGRVLVYGYAMPHDYRQHHIDFYLQHNQRVREHFQNRPGKLLEVCWENGDDWVKLCQFLERPLPNLLFPHANKSPFRR